MYPRKLEIKRSFPKAIFIVIVILTFLTNVAVQPYQLALQGKSFNLTELPHYLPTVLLNTLIYSIFAGIGFYLATRTGLGLPFIEGLYSKGERWRKFKPVLILSIIVGVVVVVLVLGVNQLLFKDLILADMVAQGVDLSTQETRQPLLWQSLLASFYGGITEEIQLRLFLLGLLAWIGSRVWHKSEGRPTLGVLWGATIISTVVFGLGHLPTLTSMGLVITPVLFVSTLTQNGIGGIAFGWLFWKRGLESAILAHFTADIAMHLIVPAILSMVS